MKRLLCATDLQPKSEAAMDRAGILAEDLGARLSLLHVVAPNGSERVLEESLRIAIARMKSRVQRPMWRHGPMPNVLIRTGNPARVIRDTVAGESPNLLIMGPHEPRNVLDGVAGTITEKVIRARKCPLLIVRGDAETHYKKVLLAADLTHESSLAVRAAESLVLREETRAIVMHVVTPLLKVPSSDSRRATRASRNRAAADLQSLMAGASADLARYEVVLEEGLPIPTILRAADVHKPDLVVIGTGAEGQIRRALLGSVGSRLLNELACDVLVVPRDSIAAPMSASSRQSKHSSA